MIVQPYQQPIRGTQINHAHPLARGLIGYWPCNDGTGLKVWDYSGNANQGTLEGGATWVPGCKGWAVNCDGVDGRIDCGNKGPLANLGNGSFWISLWMKSKDMVPLTYGNIFSKFVDSDTRIELYSLDVENQLYFILIKGDVGCWDSFSIHAAPFDTNWNHIVFVINRITDKGLLYMNTIKDGVEIDISSCPADCSNTGNVLWGTKSNGFSPYEGAFGKLHIYIGIPTQENINWLYREPYALFH